jgi:hypothetical protein
MTLEELNTFCPLTLRAKEWIDEHVQETLSGSVMPLSSSIATRGDWHRE